MTDCIHQIDLLEECERCPGWTGEGVYRSFAGPMANSMPYDTLDQFNRRHYEYVARRWNAVTSSKDGVR